MIPLPSAPSPELTVGMHAIYTDRNGTRQSCIVRRIFAGYADVEFPSGRGTFEVALRRLAPNEALNKPWPADLSAPSPEEARPMTLNAERLRSIANRLERTADRLSSILAKDDRASWQRDAAYLRELAASDSRVVSPSAGARMNEENANKLMREYRRAGIAYDRTLEDADLERLNAAGVALFRALVGPSQPSTDTTEEGR